MNSAYSIQVPVKVCKCIDNRREAKEIDRTADPYTDLFHGVGSESGFSLNTDILILSKILSFSIILKINIGRFI